MKFKYNFSPVLHNRIVLYFFFAIALIDLVYFLNIGDMYSFSVLILVGLLTSFFIKNMTVILFTAVIVTHLLKYGRSSFSEGMEGMDSSETDDSDASEEKPKKKSISSDVVSSKLKDFSKNIDNIIDNTKNEKQSELAKTMPEIKETRDKIVEHVKDMQPLLEKFQGYIEKFNTIKNSTN
jgi:histidyl-tRNA synthetase